MPVPAPTETSPFKLLKGGLSGLGFGVLVTATLALLLGIGFTNGYLIALGSSGILLISAAIIPGKVAARSLELEFHMPQRCRAERSFPFLVSVKHCGRFLATPPVFCDIKFSGQPDLSFEVASLTPGSSAKLKLKSRPLPRGLHEDWNLSLESGFPLGLFKFIYQVRLKRELSVVPRAMLPNEIHELGRDQTGEPQHQAGRLGQEEEFLALRQFRHGDRLRRIHWPASNRGRGLIIREVEFPGQLPRHIILIFHSCGPSSLIRPDRFERALSFVTGVTELMVGAARPLEVKADFFQYQSKLARSRASLRSLLDELATARRVENSSLRQLQSVLGSISLSSHLIVVSDSPLELWVDHIPPEHDATLIDVDQLSWSRAN